MSLYARIMARGEYPYRTRVQPPPEPGVPEWERTAEQVAAARAEEPLTFRHCIPCGVTWRGGPACWCCGRAAAA